MREQIRALTAVNETRKKQEKRRKRKLGFWCIETFGSRGGEGNSLTGLIKHLEPDSQSWKLETIMEEDRRLRVCHTPETLLWAVSDVATNPF